MQDIIPAFLGGCVIGGLAALFAVAVASDSSYTGAQLAQFQRMCQSNGGIDHVAGIRLYCADGAEFDHRRVGK